MATAQFGDPGIRHALPSVIPYKQHVASCELGTCVGVSFFRSNKSTFFNRVLSVLFGCSQKQVLRITARRVVATMTDEQPIDGCVVGEEKSQPMRSNTLAVQPKTSVTLGVTIAHPGPALIWQPHFHLLPKSLANWLFLSFPNSLRQITQPAVIHVFPPSCVCRQFLKFFQFIHISAIIGIVKAKSI